MLDALMVKLRDMDTHDWVKCPSATPHWPCALKWADESATLSCHKAHISHGVEIVNGFDLGINYYNANIRYVDEQILKGGVRLAKALTEIFDPKELPTPPHPKEL